MSAPDTDPTFDSLDLDAAPDRPVRPRPKTVVALVALLAWVGLFCYSELAVPAGDPVAFGVRPSPIDWPFGAALLAVGWVVVDPSPRTRRLAGRYWATVRTDALALAATGVLAVFVVVGLAGPSLVDVLEATAGITAAQGQQVAALQPPLGASVPADAVETCAGPVTAGRCHGTISHPFGTDAYGNDVFEGVVSGTRVALAVSLTGAVFVVPVGIAAGVVAASLGGPVDESLMRLADLVDVIPAIFVYVIVQIPLQKNLWLVVLVFGVLSWGNTARLVRSDALSTVEREYVAATRAAGGRPWLVVRDHVVPNVAGTAITTATYFVPKLILVEATLGWLHLSSGYVYSWGDQLGLKTAVFSGTFPVDGIPVATWWTEAFTLAAIFATVVSWYVVGDTLRTVFEPGTES
ncbi:ABC transporter permease [Halomicroarcula sp. GCM10025817]|uniref:ABC transporter permease n=1 Tax=Haloarcula TaxID=2237 RepID=UPI0023E7670E|nr:ABC transporter permease [Halomicroarcula sp. SYNS111]